MTTIGVKHFSWVDFVQGLKAAKFTDEQADYLARTAEDLIENVLEHSRYELESRELATKGDIFSIKQDIKEITKNIKELELKIEQQKYASLKFTIWTGVAVVVTLGGMLMHGFHWM